MSLYLISSVCRDNDVGTGNERSYWAKGTGFGTGSTSSGWDVEQAMLKQRAEEEHVTCLLQVITDKCTTRQSVETIPFCECQGIVNSLLLLSSVGRAPVCRVGCLNLSPG